MGDLICLLATVRTLNAILSSFDNYLYEACAYIIFQKSVDIFEIEHKTCNFLVRGVVPPEVWYKGP